MKEIMKNINMPIWHCHGKEVCLPSIDMDVCSVLQMT